MCRDGYCRNRRRQEPPAYSSRNTLIGSTFDARRAGIQHATKAISANSAATSANVAGSVAVTPYASGMPFDQFLRHRLFEPLGMNSTWFNVSEKEQSRLATMYNRTATGLQKPTAPARARSPSYFSVSAGLTSSAEDYLLFAQMLCNGGELNGKRILSPWTVDLMLSNNVGDLFNGQSGRVPKGVGFGLGGEVILNATEARVRKPNGSYGWDGAFRIYWWVNRKNRWS
jgi:CubicO group peptidase (beta-lactamase class C family)